MTLWLFLIELVMLLGGAFVLGALAQRLRQSPIIGYLLAGTIVGPLLFNPEAINQTAELGVSLLLFSIGLEFSFGRLKSMGRMAFGGGTVQVGATLALVTAVMIVPIGMAQALTLGAIVALSSTAVVMRVLVDRAEIDSVRGRSCLSILLLQDIAIVPLVIMVSMLTAGGAETSVAMHILKVAAAAGGLVAVLYILLFWLTPALLSVKGLFANRELSVLLAVSVGLGATWAAHSLGISPALGAFVAGMLLGESPFANQIQSDIGALRTIMVTLFFASVGMLLQPLFFVRQLHWILLAGATLFLFKGTVIYIVTRLFGLDHRHAVATGVSLGQIGEFSLVLAGSALQGGLFDKTTFDFILSTIIVLMFATPYMVTGAFPLAGLLSRKGRNGAGGEPAAAADADKRVLVVGFGPAGRQVVQHLNKQELETVIIDVNPQSRKEAARMGLKLYLGDATSEEILAHAGANGLCMAVVTVPDPSTAVGVVKTLRRLHPTVAIAARCRYNRHLQALHNAGADIVVDEETSIGHLLAHQIVDFMRDASGRTLACRLGGQTLHPPDADTPH